MEKKKIVVFSGAGLDAESGVATFRDNNGLWNNYKIDEVATPEGWNKDPQKVLDFYNERRREMPNVKPNRAHTSLAELENAYDVTHITQNVSDLLERAGATKIYHLHGELTKVRGDHGTGNKRNRLPSVNPVIDIGYDDIKMGDMCEVTNSQLRPNVVWFGEFPFHINKSYDAMNNADILIIVGTSLQIGYTLDMLQAVTSECRIIYIDPEPMNYLSNYGMKVEYVHEPAAKGVSDLVTELLKEDNQ
jgi:NAD-dependent deacetylase